MEGEMANGTLEVLLINARRLKDKNFLGKFVTSPFFSFNLNLWVTGIAQTFKLINGSFCS